MKYVLDTHCHTIASGHAYSTISDYAEEAARMGLELIAITDHGPKMPGSCEEIHFSNLKVIPSVINGVEVLSGIELNILNTNGDVDMRPGVLKRLNVNIASFHINIIDAGTADVNTQTILNVMKNPYINIIGHLGDPRFPINIEEIVSSARDTGTLLELNNSSLDPKSFRAGGDETIKQMLICCKKQGLPIIMGSDAHYHTALCKFELAEKILSAVDMPEELVLNTSKKAFLDAIKLKTLSGVKK